MSDGGGCLILIYSFGAFCAAIPLVVINLVAVVFLSLFYDQSQLAIWLATNTGITLVVCAIAMLVFLYLSCGDTSREELGTMCCFTIGAPCLLFFAKIGLNIWGIVALANYSHRWNNLSIFSTCIIILQLIVYAATALTIIISRLTAEHWGGGKSDNPRNA